MAATYSLQSIIQNYELLTHEDVGVREGANLFLMGLTFADDAWKITEQMITQSHHPKYQLLGAQILHQKLEREAAYIPKPDLNAMRHFLFMQLASPSLSLPTLRKVGSAAAVVAVVSCLEEWPDVVKDVVGFMQGSPGQLLSGLIALGCIAEELSRSNSVKQGIKIRVKEKILEQEALLGEVFLSALTINEKVTGLALEAVQNWVGIGFPLLKYKSIVRVLLALMEQQQVLFFQTCCKVISEGVKVTAQLKFQSLAIVDFAQETQRYAPEEIQSLKLLIQYLRSTKGPLLAAIKTAQSTESIEIYTGIVKELLLSFGFLLLEDVGFELLEIIMATLQSRNLKTSYSTFQFWLDFCEKMGKAKTDPALQLRLWNISEYLFGVLLDRTAMENEAALFQLGKEEDTLDDLDDVSFAQYRKEAQYVIKTLYEYFTRRREKQGSDLFFKILVERVQRDTHYPSIGTELAVYAVKSSLESMMKDYDTLNLVQFVQLLVLRAQSSPQVPVRVTAELLGLVKDCTREVRERQGLFLKCLALSLRFVEDEQLCHYAVYAFQSLMESIQNMASPALVNDLLAFYESKTFAKQTILEKVLDGVLTSITKLQDRPSIAQYFSRIMNAILGRNSALLGGNFDAEAFQLPLIQVKTVLDCFQHFRPEEKDYFRGIFLGISEQGVAIVTRIIAHHLNQGLKFSNVNQLGLSLAVIRSALRLCEGIAPEQIPINGYITLMNLVGRIFTGDLTLFVTYSSLVEIISKVLTQFMGTPLPSLDQWLGSHLLPIDHFFLSYAQARTLVQLDPDIMREFFSIQEGVLLYSQKIFLSQPQVQQTFDLALLALQFLNEKQMQRKVVYFVYLCVQLPNAFSGKFDRVARALFAAIPILNNICYINVGRVITVVLEGVDLKRKEAIFRELLEHDPYREVQRDLKEIMAKFFAFAIDSRVERYVKGVLNDLTDIKWKKSGSDLALHLEMRFSNWKREYNKMLKSGDPPK